MSEETKIWFDKEGVGHAFDDEYSVTIHHNTAEEMERTEASRVLASGSRSAGEGWPLSRDGSRVVYRL